MVRPSTAPPSGDALPERSSGASLTRLAAMRVLANVVTLCTITGSAAAQGPLAGDWQGCWARRRHHGGDDAGQARRGRGALHRDLRRGPAAGGRHSFADVQVQG
jgi:hypothetical protein